MASVREKLPWRRTRWILVAGVVAAVGAVGAFAAFTSDVDVTSGDFSTASIELEANGQTQSTTFSALGKTDMEPGDEVYAALQITNAGTTDFVYGMTTTASGDSTLAAALTIGVAKVSDSGSCTDASDFSAGTDIVTDSTTGLTNATFSDRSLSAGASEYLCFHVQLPSGASDSLSGKSASAVFDFTAQKQSS